MKTYAKQNNELYINTSTRKVQLIFSSPETSRRDCWIWLHNNEKPQLNSIEWVSKKVGYNVEAMQ